MSNFQPLEVVCRGSETQLQVSGNLNNNGIKVNRMIIFWENVIFINII